MSSLRSIVRCVYMNAIRALSHFCRQTVRLVRFHVTLLTDRPSFLSVRLPSSFSSFFVPQNSCWIARQHWKCCSSWSPFTVCVSVLLPVHRDGHDCVQASASLRLWCPPQQDHGSHGSASILLQNLCTCIRNVAVVLHLFFRIVIIIVIIFSSFCPPTVSGDEKIKIPSV